MDCPVCHRKTSVEIDLHADGYAEGLQECGACGTVWIERAGEVRIERTGPAPAI